MSNNPSLRSGARSRSGSIVCEERLGNLRIFKSHTPSEAIVIERGDIEDLMVALDGILNEREISPTKVLELENNPFIRADSEGHVVLSDRDIERIADTVRDRIYR